MSNGEWGGARPNYGAVAPEERKDFERERAEHERVKRMEREWKLAVAQGNYLPREAQRQAASTALAVLTQSLLSLPDNLERTCGLSAEQAEQASQMVHAALRELAAALKAMTHDS